MTELAPDLKGRVDLIEKFLATMARPATLFGQPADPVELLLPNSVTPSLLSEEYHVLHDSFFNVKDPDFGAAGDGTHADQEPIQAALDAAEDAGGGIVYVPPGTYSIATSIVIPANVIVRGAGMAVSILKAVASGTNVSFVKMEGDNDVSLEYLTVDVNNRTASIGVLAAPANPATVAERYSIRNCRIRNSDVRNGIRLPYPTADFTFESNFVENCDDGLSMYGSTSADTTGVHILNNRWRNCGDTTFGHGIALFTDTAAFGLNRTFRDVIIAGNDMRDWADPTDAIPIEPTGIENLLVANNVLGTAATRGVSMGQNTNVLCTGNVIREQSMYAFELNAGKNISIVGNVIENCATLCQQSNNIGVLEDVLVEGNQVTGTGKTVLVGNTYMCRFLDATAGVPTKRVRVINNVFRDTPFVQGIVRMGGSTQVAEDCEVSGNTYVAEIADTPSLFCNANIFQRLRVKNNYIRVGRALVAADEYVSSIQLNANALNGNITVEDNEIRYTGSWAASANANGIGTGASAPAALAGCRVTGNRISTPQGLGLGVTSADLLVRNNDTRDCTTASSPLAVPTTASVAALTLPLGPRVHKISGTTGITSITAQEREEPVALIFTGILTVTDGSNLRLNGNFVTTADDVLTLVCDGTNWWEVGRSAN